MSSGVTLEQLWNFCRLDKDTEPDLMRDFQKTAEEQVCNHVRRDLDREYPAGWPYPCRHAVKMLVAFWYDNRGAALEQRMAEPPFSLTALLKDYRSFD